MGLWIPTDEIHTHTHIHTYIHTHTHTHTHTQDRECANVEPGNEEAEP